MYDVPLMVARGYASLSFLHSAAEYINDLDVPAYIYHLGDFDPSGVNAGEKIEETLRELAPDAEIIFERIAVTPEQIDAWNLPTRPTKTSDTRAKGFGDISVELDAIEPNQLRALVQRRDRAAPARRAVRSAQGRRRKRARTARRVSSMLPPTGMCDEARPRRAARFSETHPVAGVQREHGEALGAARALGRTLEANGCDFHDLADIVEAPPIAPNGGGRTGTGARYRRADYDDDVETELPWQIMVDACADRLDRFAPKERQFLRSMQRWHGEPSVKQRTWLVALFARARGTT